MADFEKLRVWGKSYALILNVHLLAGSIQGAQYAPLRNQMVRASMSVAANIVEGRTVPSSAADSGQRSAGSGQQGS